MNTQVNRKYSIIEMTARSDLELSCVIRKSHITRVCMYDKQTILMFCFMRGITFSDHVRQVLMNCFVFVNLVGISDLPGL